MIHRRFIHSFARCVFTLSFSIMLKVFSSSSSTFFHIAANVAHAFDPCEPTHVQNDKRNVHVLCVIQCFEIPPVPNTYSRMYTACILEAEGEIAPLFYL
jgi:hypothetical protein